jgi:geranylgeranyl reductase family protein
LSSIATAMISKSQINRRGKPTLRHDVIVVGGGPSGSFLAWKLASQGVRVLLLDRSRFPREKVCGDYVEPRGLRLLDKIGCLESLEKNRPLPITHSATFINSKCCYRGEIPFYTNSRGLLPHGYIIPRETLDYALLKTASEAGAIVEQEALVTRVKASEQEVLVEAQRGRDHVIYKGRIVVGADGVNSVVARSAGLLANDRRYLAVSQRAYGEGVEEDLGEAVFYFDKDFFPGYGWMFPMRGGMANLGVGILSEASERLHINIPQLFAKFVHKLKRTNPSCARLKLVRPPIGGIVKTYGGAGLNHFDGGLLIGDAGNFVDPMTGEGITPGMESALIAARVVLDALDAGRFDSKFLSEYQNAYRAYFDPSMVFLDLCATTMRNAHFAKSWLDVMVRGCELAENDPEFARTTGAYFGGLEINPPGILAQIWLSMARSIASLGSRSLEAFYRTSPPVPIVSALSDSVGWQGEWWRSILSDPLWHASWTFDLERKWIYFLATINKVKADPRSEGLVV